MWLSVAVVLLSLVLLLFRYRFRRNSKYTIAFFHPYCNDGGGGERVLWCAVKSVQQMKKDARCVIYTGLEANAKTDEILSKVKTHFGITLLRDVEFILLKKRWLVEASTWPRFTLLGQSLGSMVLAWEALSALTPDVFIDTMGYSFSFPIFALLGGSRVGCYVHYPTISSDMLQKVSERKFSYNNPSEVSQSSTKTALKLFFMGSFSEVVMVNSTWTLNHINDIWKTPQNTSIVYPPCNTSLLQQLPIDKRERLIISIGQFRPEKDHALQIDSFHTFLRDFPQWKGKVKFFLIGSSRNEGDQKRIEKLKQQVKDLSLENDVEFQINVPFDQLKTFLSKALIGLHSMWNEHFGIGIVEFMAAGVIPVAHNSGGPKSDIVVEREGKITGFLASTPSEYAGHFAQILEMTDKETKEIQFNARKAAQRFSDETFELQFQHYIRKIVK